ncbi:unnamed protein product (macronuclear) [Paramecium tetraurelia]|uniref:Transmembrane protein n=1 Tax=Paramecium tetraurelia TaxID=5888 RepID=A0BGA0_PARTE|nr:uncharacterized protein GSPATT00028602001 [Paramecium tetraurelia]CAK57567.1 unnamed protein product [Paramecium tetraurelia]|eukprot:XP_001424965.1 hypothetical protein (macronuclear) [Paramecium tetraurelia strain d4-2]
MIPEQTKRVVQYKDSKTTIGMKVTSSNETLLRCLSYDKNILFEPYMVNEIKLLSPSINSGYTDESLKINRTANVNDPDFIMKNPVLVGLANTTSQGFMVLTSNHLLHLFQLDYSQLSNKFAIKSNQTFNFSDLRQTQYEPVSPQLIWFDQKSCALIVFPQQIIIGKLVDGQFSFKNSNISISNEEEYIGITKLHKGFVFVARGRLGIDIYSLHDQGQLIFISNLHNQISNYIQNMYIIDFSFGGFDNNYIFVLDKFQGLMIFSISDQTFTLTKWLDSLQEIKGAKLIKTHRNVVMIMVEHNSYNLILEYCIYSQDQKLFYIKTHYLDGKYFDIDIEEQFAIVRGYDGHKIIYHSIHEGFQVNYNSPITDESWEDGTEFQEDIDQYAIIPQMQSFYLTQHLQQNFLVAISFRSLIFVRFIRVEPYVECKLTNLSTKNSQITVNAVLNSTWCKEKFQQQLVYNQSFYSDLVMCKKELNFSIKVINTLEEEQNNYYYIVIIVITSLILLCLLLVALRIFFTKYRQDQQNLVSVIDQLGKRGYTAEKSQDQISGF